MEADDITILNLALSKRLLGLHRLDHARFNFLQARGISFSHDSIRKNAYTHLVQLERRSRRPSHPLVDKRDEIANFV